jgi:uncharacterized protein
MRTFSWTVIFFCAGVLLANRAAADEASHRKAVLEFFKLADMENMMNENIDTMVQAQVQMNPSMAPVADTFKQFMAKYMSWKALESEFVTIYMKTFDEAELKQMLAFYKTPVGKKSLRQMPKLIQQGAQVGADRVQQHMPELMQELQKQSAGKQPPKGAQAAPPPAHAPQAAPALPPAKPAKAPAANAAQTTK